MSKMISFKDKYPELLKHWDFDKNIESPDTIPCRTTKKYYWKCDLNHSIYTDPYTMYGYSNGCPYCGGRKVLKGFNDLWTTHPEIAKYLANPNEGFQITYGSHKKLDWKCPLCGQIVKSKSANEIISRNKIACKYCGDGVSYPEKVFISLFDYLNVNYIYQLTRKYDGFDWCDKYRYDFYLPDYATIIEVNGGFHYGKEYKHTNALTSEQIIKVDKIKENLALHNNIKNYISINCFHSNFGFIKNNILNSQMANILDLNNVSWETVENNIIGSYVVDVCKYFNEHSDMTIQDIAKHFSRHYGTITIYLKNGTKLGLCNYDSSQHKKDACKHYHWKQKVRCITTNEIFESVKSAKETYNASNVSLCCTGKIKTSGHLPDGTRLQWEYVTE